MNQPSSPTPERQADGHQQAPEESSPPAPKRKRVLLVEDEPATRLVLLQKLRAAGLDVDVAVNGRVAVDKVRASPPDAIFMDLLLPTVKGVDVIKEARQHPQFADRPIFVCASAARMAAWSHRAIKAGATKVFDRGSFPVDAMVAEVAAALLGSASTAKTLPKAKAKKADPETSSEQLQREPADSSNPPSMHGPALSPSNGPPLEDSPASDDALTPPYTFMKRVLKRLGLAKPSDSTPADGSAVPPPIPGVTEPLPLNPAAETAPQLWPAHAPSPVPATAEPSPRAPSARTTVPDTDQFQLAGSGLGAAVIAFDENNQILTAGEAASSLFGWENGALVGQNLKVLLQEGVDHLVAKFLQEPPSTNRGEGAHALHVNARRKDGTQFPASVTTLTWASDTTLMRKGDDTRSCWTAVFRVLSPAPGVVGQASTTPSRVEPSPSVPQLAPSTNSWLVPPTGSGPAPLPWSHGPPRPERAEVTRVEPVERPPAETVELISSELNLVRAALEQESQARLLLERQPLDIPVAKQEMAREASAPPSPAAELPKSSEQLGERLAEAKASARQAAEALQEQIALSRRAEEELAGVRRERDELQARLAAEQELAAGLRQRGQQLEGQLQAAAGDLQSTKADAAQNLKERGVLVSEFETQESELHTQLDEAKASAERAEHGLREETERNRGFEQRLQVFGNSLRLEQLERSKRFEEEMVALRHERDHLQGELTAQQAAAEESKRRTDDLESRLAENAATLARAKAEKDKQEAERQRSEAELRQQLATAELLSRELASACAQAEERSSRFAQELNDLRQQRDELNGKLSSEQLAAAESRQRADELEARVQDNAAELARAKAELATAGRDARFEMELVSLQQVRDALCSKLMAEQWSGNESRRRTEEVENQLRNNAAELDRVKADRDQLAGEQTRLSSELRMQLQAATAATVQLEGSLRQKAEQCGRMEAELAGLQQTGQELTGQLRTEHASTVEFKQRSDTLETSLRESAGELERLKADRQKQAAEQARLESQLQEQLTAAKAAAEQAEASRREEADRNRDFEERLRVCANNLKQEQERLVQRYEADAAGLKQERDSLHQQLGEAQRAAAAAGEQSAAADSRFRQLGSTLEQAKADLKKQTSERSAAEADLRSQLSAAKAAAKKAEDALRQKNAQSTRYEQELTNFRQERHEIHDKFAAEQQAVTKAKRRIKELENQVQRDAGELARLKTDADRAAAERGRTESALRAELATARNSAKKSDAACEAQATQGERLKEELIVLRQLQEELSARQTSEQNNAGEARRQIEDLEQRLRQNAAELGRTQAALENQAAELARQASAQPHPAAASDELEKECGRLRETEAAQTAQLSELDRRVRESVASLARATADLEKERGERRRIEQRSGAMTAQLQELHEKFKQQLGADRAAQERITHLEQQMLEREDAHTRVSADLQQEAAARQLAEDQLRTTADLSSHLRNCLSSFAQAKSGFKVMQDQLEAQIQAHQSALHEREERLQKEIAERQRLEEALAGTRRTLQEHSQGKAIEMAKLQSEVQMHEFERTRLQSEAVQSRYATVDSARVGSAMLNSFRRQIRQPVDHLLQTSRRLLEAGLEAEQKKLAESVLENALLLQSSVQEGALPAGSTRSGDPQLKTEAPAEQRPASDNLQA